MPAVDPLRAKALAVRSSRDAGGQYVVDLHPDGRWTCTCPTNLAGDACAHLAAVLLVTTQGAAA